MKSRSLLSLTVIVVSMCIWNGCSKKTSAQNTASTRDIEAVTTNYGGFRNRVEWGRHLVILGGCNDCHTPKKMTAMGPVPDTTLRLSGHPAAIPPPDVNRSEIERKGLVVTNDLTVWVGPWGISYAANLTPDETGIGNWTPAQFIKAIREGKYQGMDGTRPLLPPMNFVAKEVGTMSDAELGAIFSYLKSLKPVHNLVTEPEPPVLAAKH